MRIEQTGTRTYEGGGTMLYYEVGEWCFEVFIDADGGVGEDGDLDYARETAKVWQAWAVFVERQNERGWL